MTSISTDESKTEKKKKKKKKKRNAAIVAIEDDDNLPLNSVTDGKDLPPNVSTVKQETPTSNSASKTSSLSHTRASSFPGNFPLVTEGSAEVKSRVNEQAFTDITKSISLPDNSLPVENVVEIAPQGSKNNSFDLEEVPGKMTAESEYVSNREGVQESPAGEDTENFVLETFDFLRAQPRVDEGKTNSQEVKYETERYNEKEISTDIPTVDGESCEPVLLPQDDFKLSENDLYSFESKRFSDGSSTVKASFFSKEKDDLNQGLTSEDSFRVYSLTEDDSETDANFSMAQFQAPKEVEINIKEGEAVATEPVVDALKSSTPVNLIEREDMKNGSFVAKEHLDTRYSPSGIAVKQERMNGQENLDNEEFRNDSNDYDEVTTGAELQPGTFEPVVLLDSGESLVPLTEGDLTTAKTGTQSTFYCAPDASMENDRDSTSLSRLVKGEIIFPGIFKLESYKRDKMKSAKLGNGDRVRRVLENLESRKILFDIFQDWKVLEKDNRSWKYPQLEQ